jgi:hypothetical protein
MTWATTPDIKHPNYGALVTDEFDAGQEVGARIACQIFERQDSDYCLQYASVAWNKEADPDNIPWDVNNQEERGQHWRLVYRFYPQVKA